MQIIFLVIVYNIQVYSINQLEYIPDISKCHTGSKKANNFKFYFPCYYITKKLRNELLVRHSINAILIISLFIVEICFIIPRKDRAQFNKRYLKKYNKTKLHSMDF